MYHIRGNIVSEPRSIGTTRYEVQGMLKLKATYQLRRASTTSKCFSLKIPLENFKNR